MNHHRFLIGRNHPNSDVARRIADNRLAHLVGGAVKLQPHPLKPAADSRPNLRTVLTNAGCKDQQFAAPQRDCGGCDLLGSALAEHLERKRCSRILAGEQRTYIMTET